MVVICWISWLFPVLVSTLVTPPLPVPPPTTVASPLLTNAWSVEFDTLTCVCTLLSVTTVAELMPAPAVVDNAPGMPNALSPAMLLDCAAPPPAATPPVWLGEMVKVGTTTFSIKS